MIYTLTLNPSLDKSFYLPKILNDDINRLKEVYEDPGGKGINVSKAIKEFGGEALALGLVGGENGKKLKRLLSEKGIPFSFTKIEGEIRSIYNIFEEKGRVIRLNEPGPEIKIEESKRLLKKIISLPLKERDFFVISGSIPLGIKENIYQEIIEKIRGRAKVALDVDGKPGRYGVLAKPQILKQNIYELGRLFKKKIRKKEEIVFLGQRLLDSGIEKVIISLGREGAIGLNKEGSFWVKPPSVLEKSSVGSGDFLLGGLIYSLSKGEGFSDSLRLGVSAGTASIRYPGTQLAPYSEILKLYHSIKTIKCNNAEGSLKPQRK